MTINSAYRTPAHNKAVGGATGSQHVKGTAADIVVAGAAPLEVAQYAEYLMPRAAVSGLSVLYPCGCTLHPLPLGQPQRKGGGCQRMAWLRSARRAGRWEIQHRGRVPGLGPGDGPEAHRQGLPGCRCQSLDLSHDMVRLLVIQDRAGCYRE